ncbi:HTH-type transcriptional regulator PrtR [Synergistales bacterium]|nr:HTH-type transcriptional regulator PrtR [Synergistales bacterium]
MKNLAVFAQRLKEQRHAKNLTQKKLASLVGVESNTVYKWENSLASPSLDTVKKIADALKTNVAYLIGDWDDPAPKNPGSVNFVSSPKMTAGTLSSEKSNIAKIIPLSGKFIKVDLYDLKTCAGFGWNQDDTDVEKIDSLDVPQEWIGNVDVERPPFAVIVDGESMEDADIPSGAYAFINPAAEYTSGDSVMVCYGIDKVAAIKRIYFIPGGGIELRSASESIQYPVIRYTPDQQRLDEDRCEIRGKVMFSRVVPIKG